MEAEEGCYLTAEEQEMQDKEQQQARQEVLQRTIVFEGSVLEGVGRPCVCAWDDLGIGVSVKGFINEHGLSLAYIVGCTSPNLITGLLVT